MIEMRYQDLAFIGRTNFFPEEILDTRVTIRRSMSGIRRTLVKKACIRRFSVVVETLSRATYLELRAFVIAVQGKTFQVSFLEAQRENNTGLPINQDYGTPLETALTVRLLSVPVVFTEKNRYQTDIPLSFEEAI